MDKDEKKAAAKAAPPKKKVSLVFLGGSRIGGVPGLPEDMKKGDTVEVSEELAADLLAQEFPRRFEKKSSKSI